MSASRCWSRSTTNASTTEHQYPHACQLFVPGPLRFWEDIGDLAPGESRYFPVHYLVPDLRRDQITFWATAMGRRDIDNGLPLSFAPVVEDSQFVRVRIIRR